MTAPERVDRRAERVRAQGDLELARAEAEAVRAETAARMALVQEEAETRAADRRDAARERRRVGRQAHRSDLAGRARVLAGRAPNLAGVAACLAPTVLAMRGQYAFARDEMQLGGLSFLAPTMLEGAAWMLVAVRHQAARAGHRTWLLAAGVWTLALVGAALNYWHGASSASPQVGAMYAAASLVGFGLVELLEWRRRAATRAGRTPRVGLLRALRFPLVAWSAWSRQVEMGPDGDPGEAWRQVWQDRYDVEPGADRAARKSGRRRVQVADDRRRGRRPRQAVPGPAGEPRQALAPTWRGGVRSRRPGPRRRVAGRVSPGRRPAVVPDGQQSAETREQKVARLVDAGHGRNVIARLMGEKPHQVRPAIDAYKASDAYRQRREAQT